MLCKCSKCSFHPSCNAVSYGFVLICIDWPKQSTFGYHKYRKYKRDNAYSLHKSVAKETTLGIFSPIMQLQMVSNIMRATNTMLSIFLKCKTYNLGLLNYLANGSFFDMKLNFL